MAKKRKNQKFCPRCGYTSKRGDTYCMNCGYSYRKRKKKTPLLVWIIILIILAIAIFLMLNKLNIIGIENYIPEPLKNFSLFKNSS